MKSQSRVLIVFSLLGFQIWKGEEGYLCAYRKMWEVEWPSLFVQLLFLEKLLSIFPSTTYQALLLSASSEMHSPAILGRMHGPYVWSLKTFDRFLASMDIPQGITIRAITCIHGISPSPQSLPCLRKLLFHWSSLSCSSKCLHLRFNLWGSYCLCIADFTFKSQIL